MDHFDFYLDSINKRDFSLEAVEMIAATNQLAKIYCLYYQSGLLGPISQRKVQASVGLKSGELPFTNLAKLPLVAGSLNFNQKKNAVIFLSRGLIGFRSATLLYYFYEPYWESEEFKNSYKKASFLVKYWIKLYQKLVIRSLRKNQERVFCSSQALAARYGLDPKRVVYPFFKSEDYPRIELDADRSSITIILTGSKIEQRLALKQWITENPSTYSFFIFGTPEHQVEFSELGEKVRFESTYCSATLQAAFIQSKVTFVFNHTEIFDVTMGSLSSGTLVAHLPNELIEEVIPTGMRLVCETVEVFLQIIAEMSYRKNSSQTSIDKGEARRFSLRFSERVFKDKILQHVQNLQK